MSSTSARPYNAQATTSHRLSNLRRATQNAPSLRPPASPSVQREDIQPNEVNTTYGFGRLRTKAAAAPPLLLPSRPPPANKHLAPNGSAARPRGPSQGRGGRGSRGGRGGSRGGGGVSSPRLSHQLPSRPMNPPTAERGFNTTTRELPQRQDTPAQAIAAAKKQRCHESEEIVPRASPLEHESTVGLRETQGGQTDGRGQEKREQKPQDGLERAKRERKADKRRRKKMRRMEREKQKQEGGQGDEKKPPLEETAAPPVWPKPQSVELSSGMVNSRGTDFSDQKTMLRPPDAAANGPDRADKEDSTHAQVKLAVREAPTQRAVSQEASVADSPEQRGDELVSGHPQASVAQVPQAPLPAVELACDFFTEDHAERDVEQGIISESLRPSPVSSSEMPMVHVDDQKPTLDAWPTPDTGLRSPPKERLSEPRTTNAPLRLYPQGNITQSASPPITDDEPPLDAVTALDSVEESEASHTKAPNTKRKRSVDTSEEDLDQVAPLQQEAHEDSVMAEESTPAEESRFAEGTPVSTAIKVTGSDTSSGQPPRSTSSEATSQASSSMRLSSSIWPMPFVGSYVPHFKWLTALTPQSSSDDRKALFAVSIKGKTAVRLIPRQHDNDRLDYWRPADLTNDIVPQDVRRVSSHAVAVVSASESTIGEGNPQVALVLAHRGGYGGRDLFASSTTLSPRPHLGGATAVAPFLPMENADLTLVTGGADGVVYAWSRSEEETRTQRLHSLLHRRPVSAIETLPRESLVVSTCRPVRGGQHGTEVVAFDARETKLVHNWKSSDSVANISRTSHVKVVDFSLLRADYDQHKLFDLRTSHRPILSFGWASDADLRSLGRPVFVRNHCIQSCPDGRIRMWDLRRADEVSQEVAVCQDALSDTVYDAADAGAAGNQIFTLAPNNAYRMPLVPV